MPRRVGSSINEWLLSQADLLCLPRATAEARPEPRRLGDEDADEQVIFFAECAKTILKHWIPIEPAPWMGEDALSQTAHYHLYPKALACIEWTRTERIKDGRVIAGRYYLDTTDKRILSEARQEKVRKLMTALAARIRRTSAVRSGGRYPIFVGRVLADQLARAKRRLVYRNGVTPVELVGD